MKLSPAKLVLPLAALAIAAVAGCRAAKVYPDPMPGWHNGDYSVIFGRLQRIAATDPDKPPVWVIRFGRPNDPYRGELAVMPPESLIGYSGGEQVEIRGVLRPDRIYPDYNGTWFQVRNIRMWSPHE